MNMHPVTDQISKVSRSSTMMALADIRAPMRHCSEAAADKVINLPELLENILVHLEINDLFVRQRVSKGFQATIQESIPIQRKICLLPGPPIDIIDNISSVVNPFLFKSFVSISHCVISVQEAVYAGEALYRLQIFPQTPTHSFPSPE